jgi:hypothetical protein
MRGQALAMHTRRTTLRSLAAGAAATFTLAVVLAACGGTIPSSVPSIAVPTLPPNMASGMAACVDAPTQALLDQLKATGADVPTLLEANKDALIAGLNGLESSDPDTTAWRDALVDALESGDADAAADEIARLANNEVTIAPC